MKTSTTDERQRGQPVFLLLQGPLSPFYSQIAGYLRQAGVAVHKIHFCGSDVLDWHHDGAIAYTGTIGQWSGFLDATAKRLGVTHLLMHGDRRPYHKRALAWAARNDVSGFVTELGYLRPDWMTIEPWGTGMFSSFPRDPATIRKIAATGPAIDEAVQFRGSNGAVVMQEARWTVSNLALMWKFPHHETHRSQSPWIVYPGWLRAQLSKALRARDTAPSVDISETDFVFGLQLEGDYQLRDRAPFDDRLAGIEHVARSFARHAPGDARLVFKPHPHEFRGPQLRRQLASLASDLNISKRTAIVSDCSIAEACRNSAGFVTINSSSGFEALSVGCPVCTVAPTIYGLQGLTHQGALETFWREPQRPDADLLADLKRALAATIQVRGTLYDRRGRDVAARGTAERALEFALGKRTIEAGPV